jgi:hypothetical protein
MKITRVLQSTILAVAIVGALLITPTAANARVFVSVGFAPPLIPVYEQPLAPGYGYIWTPGYWAYGDDGYYWVDGAWVYPPYVDALWTPGFYGGYWNGGRFFYNGAYNHLGFHNGFVYNHPVAGFDGRPGGAAIARNEGNAMRNGPESFNRGSALNGNSFANRGAENRGANSFAQNRSSFNGNAGRSETNSQMRSYNGGNAYAGGSRGSYAAPQSRGFSGGGGYGGGARVSGGSAGGGGGFHGGGGGGGHAGGGHR